MATALTVKATEKSTYVITATFTDEDDAAVVPTAITWTLSDVGGDIINSRDGIDFEVDNGLGAAGTLASTVSIILTGDDLQMLGERPTEIRRFLLEATYDSSLGNGLNLRGACQFEINNLVAIT